ncbi:MAG: tRNA (adenosine(37)-N6)-threonylcarbamoyltransferase complex ATPase subunit type 1 TsaE [Draconibacterium sp.]|nr:MAG: tRNA (adenosine(37)-N6)-threonylcarbamoyltransferase complex ATPase subunit type 1 TsaE [Draconibacterium sp.]
MFFEEIRKKGDLYRVAEKLLNQFSDERIFAFYGKMGAGKTTFIQAICKVLGTTDNVTSPTFALINEYRSGKNKPIYHFDFYRIKHLEEAYDMGYEDYLFSGDYCFIEWPEMIAPLLPEKVVKVSIEVDDNECRLITAKSIM